MLAYSRYAESIIISHSDIGFMSVGSLITPGKSMYLKSIGIIATKSHPVDKRRIISYSCPKALAKSRLHG